MEKGPQVSQSSVNVKVIALTFVRRSFFKARVGFVLGMTFIFKAKPTVSLVFKSEVFLHSEEMSAPYSSCFVIILSHFRQEIVGISALSERLLVISQP